MVDGSRRAAAKVVFITTDVMGKATEHTSGAAVTCATGVLGKPGALDLGTPGRVEITVPLYGGLGE